MLGGSCYKRGDASAADPGDLQDASAADPRSFVLVVLSLLVAILFKMARRPRPMTCSFEPAELVAAWKSLAGLRDPGFSCQGTSYGSTYRGSADEEGLQVLLRFAPTGFPSHPCLRVTLLVLHNEFNILQVDEQKLDKAASLAAEAWRTMCKRVYNLRVAEAISRPASLQGLIDAIELRPSLMMS